VKSDTTGERLWRLRKRQHSIDAVLQIDHRGIMLEFTMNGRRLTSRRCVSRAQAIETATERRFELERAGWATHW
jgi:hypothetical protein